jgi:hypothetical protein
MNRRELLQSVLAIPAVKSIAVAQIGPRDVIVIESDELISEFARERITETLKQVWPDNKAVVLSGGLRMRIAREAPSTT